MFKVVSLIPARGGSKEIPRKNIKLLAGKPLIVHTIIATLRSKLIEETFVSTDDNEIAKISEEWGAKVIIRPSDLASDTASSESVLFHFAKQVDFDILVFLQCTSPLTSPDDIDGALNKFITGNYDSMISVCTDHGAFLCGGFLWNGEGDSINYDYKKRPRRQDTVKTYRENGAFYIITKTNLLKFQNRLGGNIGLYEMPIYRSYEVDSLEDFIFLEHLYPILINNQISLMTLKRIKLVIFDVDGVFTNGTVYIDSQGDEILKFSRIDGKGIELLRNIGFKIAVISAEFSPIVEKRMKKMQINDVYLGIKNKLDVYQRLLEKHQLKHDQVCFCGDDIQDLDILKIVGFAACPKSSQLPVQKISHYHSPFEGGNGFVRDICNLLIASRESHPEKFQ